MAESTRAGAAANEAIARQVAEQVAAAMEVVRTDAEAARVETERLAADDRIAFAAAGRAEIEALVQASSAAQDARFAAVQKLADESAKEAAEANAKLAAIEAARQLPGTTLGGTSSLTPTPASWSIPTISRAVVATFKDNEYDLRNMPLTDYIAKLVSAVSSSPEIVALLQIASSVRFGDLGSVPPFDEEADTALWSILLMSTKAQARELVQQHGAISGATGVSSAIRAVHALSKACEDTSLASLANNLKSIFLGAAIGQAANPVLAVLDIEVKVRKVCEQFNVTVAPWLLFCAVFARIDRSAYGQIVEDIGSEDAREFDVGALSKLKNSLSARFVATGSGKKPVQAIQANYAAAGNQKLAQQKSQKRQENAHIDSFRPTIQGGPRAPKAAVPKDATCRLCNKPFVRTFTYANGSLMPFKQCWECSRSKKAADVNANLLIESTPEEAEQDGGVSAYDHFVEQFVDMFSVTTEQQTAPSADCFKVPPLDCSSSVEIYRASECVEGFQEVPIPKVNVLAMMDSQYEKYERVQFAVGDLSGAPNKSVVAIDGVKQSGGPSTMSTTSAIVPGHSDFHPPANDDDTAIYGVTDESTTLASGAPGADFETPEHATGIVGSEDSGLSEQSHDDALEKFSVPDKSVEAADEMLFAATTSLAPNSRLPCTPPSPRSPGTPASPRSPTMVLWRILPCRTSRLRQPARTRSPQPPPRVRFHLPPVVRRTPPAP